jgi:hypothetical protein
MKVRVNLTSDPVSLAVIAADGLEHAAMAAAAKTEANIEATLPGEKTLSVNETLLEILKPWLGAILEIERHPWVNEVSVTLMQKEEGAYVLSVEAWAKSQRFKAADFESLLAAIKDFDPKAAAKQEARQTIDRLKVEIADLEKQI